MPVKRDIWTVDLKEHLKINPKTKQLKIINSKIKFLKCQRIFLLKIGSHREGQFLMRDQCLVKEIKAITKNKQIKCYFKAELKKKKFGKKKRNSLLNKSMNKKLKLLNTNRSTKTRTRNSMKLKVN